MSPQKSLQDRIYQAQCYGSVEPIEYMVPYPNLGTLVVGQNIKLADRIWYSPLEMTYAELYRKIQQTANWLESKDISNHDRVLLVNCPSPETEILAFGIWSIGATLVLAGDEEIGGAITTTKPKLIIATNLNPVGTIEYTTPGSIAEACRTIPGKYQVKHQALLSDEALVLWVAGSGVRLSHYNLLINASGTLSQFAPINDSILHIDLPTDSSAWAVLQTILPIYAGIGMSPDEGNFRIGLDQSEPADYCLNYDLTSNSIDDRQIHILPEATAVLKIGDRPIPLTEISEKNTGKIIVSGHSVMMGYTDDKSNEQSFTESGLEILV